jgi:hypothetical protein
MISPAQFTITEYADYSHTTRGGLRPVYQSLALCLRDASRFAAALSYARGAFVEVSPTVSEETYREWWYAGSIWRAANVPPICGGGQ